MRNLAILPRLAVLIACGVITSHAAPITIGGANMELDVCPAGEHGVRLTLKPVEDSRDVPSNPALVEDHPPAPSLVLRDLGAPVSAVVGKLTVAIHASPFTVRITGTDGGMIQSLEFRDDGSITFPLDDQPVLGLGEGGPLPAKDSDWLKAPVEFDRRGRRHAMQPRWQGDAYGSRNPVPLLIGTRGWGIYFASPWGSLDLGKPEQGSFTPFPTPGSPTIRQTQHNQQEALGKGIPPVATVVRNFRDVFVFDARDPAAMMKDIATICGPAVMPPKWALGYMQSHRTLDDDKGMVGIVDTFREKRIPIDAVIYLGTGFTPRGWNTPQPSFDFNPEVFKRDPAVVIADLHDRHAKVVLHIVPWDRDRLPVLSGSIPPANDGAPLLDYWKQHLGLVKAGVDGWWPDEGDWFDLHERLKRHQLYYQGPLSSQPDRRPWSLHRNGYLGIARWGGWVWSGDTESSWKTLETQIAVGLNHSLSLSPYWGSDIGGFFSSGRLTGELYARWFQFGAFCPSFRSHGRTWWTRLPWGWGLDELGPVEEKSPPALTELRNPEIEEVVKRYDELRYQLLSYNYTLAWQTRDTGMPFMRALWLHYPQDPKARGLGNEYLWGGDLLIAPVFESGAKSRDVYLPAGRWYDWWTREKVEGGRTINRPVDLATMPIYARAGSIIPIDPIRQFTGESVDTPLTLRIYQGADGNSELYEDDGESLGYLNGKSTLTSLQWNDAAGKLTIQPRDPASHTLPQKSRVFRVEFFPDETVATIEYHGDRVELVNPSNGS